MTGLLGGVVEKFVVSKITNKLSDKLEARSEKKKATAKRK
jgi:hypothetical protein